MARRMKSQIMGRVTEVGWEEKAWRASTHENYVMVRIRLGRTKDEKMAEINLTDFKMKLLNKDVVIFPQ